MLQLPQEMRETPKGIFKMFLNDPHYSLFYYYYTLMSGLSLIEFLAEYSLKISYGNTTFAGAW